MSAFYKEYQYIYKRYDTLDTKVYLVIDNYYIEDISNEVKYLVAYTSSSLSTLLAALREKYTSSDYDFVLITKLALERFAYIASTEPY